MLSSPVKTANNATGQLLYALCIAWSSALLFVVQPIMAKSLLPRFGGSASVWITCILFFQVVLLLGYLYSFCVTRYLGPRTQALVHLALLTLSLAALPLKTRLEPAGAGPITAILLVLALSVGLPYFVLSTTSPLLQWWLAASKGRFPYRLFAVSNAASLSALLAYPLIFEPFLSARLHMAWWSAAYAVLVVLLGTAAARSLVQTSSPGPRPALTVHQPWLWIALAACGSTLWLAVTNYLGQEVGAMPLLWIVPMSVYLLSFVLCFESDGWYRPSLFRWLMPAAWIAICSRIALEGSVAASLQWEIPIFSAALFICCMFCHGELARSRPAPQDGLTFFYLMVASGGALGGIFVGVIAPNLFSTFLELPLAVTASVFLALYFLFGVRSPRRLIRLGIVATLAFAVATRYQAGHVIRARNFYGAVQIRDSGDSATAARALYNGRTLHGLEFLSPNLRRTPTTYYGTQSGVGLVLASSRIAHRRVAIVGLGAGTLATYGRNGDFFRFYDINPAVIRAAQESFDFLRASDAATDIVRGDGRLMLEREPTHSYDIVVLDAFSDDAIPVHLLTREAMAMYFDRLRPGGLLLVHLTNRYLDLSAEIEAVANDLGKHVLCIHSRRDPAEGTEAADWAIVAADRADFSALTPYAHAPSERKLRPWTDEYSSLIQLWK